MTDITCVILAGGLARRMGHVDKALINLDGRSLLDHVIAIMADQCPAIIINANGDPSRFAAYDHPVVPDSLSGFPGPLAGVLAGMEWVRDNQPDGKWIASIPVDTPFAPVDLVAKMARDIDHQNAHMACARSAGRNHPVIGLWPVWLAKQLRRAMVEEDMRKVDLWTARYKLAVTEFSAVPVDPFFNINRREDIEQAEKILRDRHDNNKNKHP
jgi:molybdopterin-guanine dinucleotide biosynthesis protein A